MNYKQLSNYLQSAYKNGAVEPITNFEKKLDIEKSYFVQLETVKHYLEKGAKIAGKKIGLTSEKMQQSVGINEPDYGHLFDFMKVSSGDKVISDSVIQPRVEGEIAFVLKKKITGPHVTVRDVIEATEYIQPAIEFVDSRIKHWNLTIMDTICDNASSGLFVLGEEKFELLDESSLALEKMDLYKNGEKMNSGTGADCLENPIFAVVWLANKLSQFGISLEAGEVILSGALSAAIHALSGDHFEMKFQHLGSVEVTF